MRYFLYKDFKPSIQKLKSKGGLYAKSAQKAMATIGGVRLKEEIDNDPLNELKVTNNGETRIDHCIKYELGHGCRLITILNNDVRVICFAGIHADCDNWLDKNRRMKLVINKDYELIETYESNDITNEELRINTESDFANGLLYKKLPERNFDFIVQGIQRSLVREFEQLTSISEEDEIAELCLQIGSEKTNVLFDVFCMLQKSDVDGAKARIDTYINENMKVESLTPDEIDKIVEGESFIDFENFDADILEHLMETADYQKWMLFMHPEQRKIVEKDYNGPAKLSGVSGSGKTCVLIKRAIRLAKKYENQRVLILTINKSLANLIDELKNIAAPLGVRENIEVKSFWQLSREMLNLFEPDHLKLYDDMTWRTNEHIDEIWNEYYQCESNNNDAEVMLPVHKTLLVRNIYPQEYIKQEFDWIRSAFAPATRNEYLSVERKGRYEALDKSYREYILKGLSSWEEKMSFIGVTDYLGLANALCKYMQKIEPSYRSILIDEEQDFGTVELQIIRRLVSEGENDIFLCGDFAQKVYSKNHSYQSSGINITGRISTIKKNYRNSREILSAAYHILKENINDEIIKAEEYELLDPEYANYSNTRPLLLKADSLKDEIAYAIDLLKNNCEDYKKCCIAICGYSLNEVRNIGNKIGLTVLDGTIGLGAANMFLSDLEQTKGFEFDYMCILNCNEGVVPNKNIPERENYRDLSKLYVAMTRAKIELYISYSDELSSFIFNSKDLFTVASWEEHASKANDIGEELQTEFLKQKKDKSVVKISGKKFIYKKEAVGISGELYDKLIQHITGRKMAEDGKTKEWICIEDAYNESNVPNIAQLFGSQKTWPEFRELVKGIKT